MSTNKKRSILIVLLFNSIFSFGQKPELKIPSGYNKYSFKSIKHSQDGKYLIVASEEGVKIFDVETTRELRNFNCYSNEQAEISFDNKYLINSYFSGENNPISYVYDVLTGSKVFPMDGNISKFSPDNKYVATANFDFGINIYELSTGNLVNRFSYNLNCSKSSFLCYISKIEFSPDNKQVAIFGSTGSDMERTQTFIYDVLSGIKLNSIEGHSPKYSNDGKHIFTINDKHTKVTVFTNTNNVFEKSHEFLGFSANISNDGKYICVSNNDVSEESFEPNISIYDILTGKKIKTYIIENGDYINEVLFSPNGNYLSVSYRNKGVDLINLNDNSKPINFKGDIANFSSDNNYITIGYNNSIKIYYVKSGKLSKVLWGGTQSKVKSELSQDGSYNLIATWTDNLIPNSHSFYDLFKFKNKDLMLSNLININDINIPHFTFSKDGKYFVSEPEMNKKTYDVGDIKIYDVLSGKIKQNLPSFNNDLVRFSFSANNKYLAATSEFGWICIIYDIETGLKIREFNLKDIDIEKTCFSPDNKSLLMTCDDGTSKIYDLISGALLYSLNGNNRYVENSIYSPDGNFILVTSRDDSPSATEKSIPNSAKLFHAKTGIEKYSITSHNDNINYGSFSNDGKYIVTASDDKTAIVSEVLSGKAIFTLKSPHNKAVKFAKFSNDDNYIATQSDSNKIDYWDAKKGKYLFTRFFLNNDDFVEYDGNYRFDGTPNAIKMLYFVCGMEIIDLTQVKESLYQPNLVARILNGENLEHLPKLADIEICGVSPIVEPVDKKDGEFYYKITSRKGGVGDVDIFINGILRETINSNSLKMINGNYEIKISHELINDNIIQGEELSITVVAKTKVNGINSRGVISVVGEKSDKISQRKPEIFAIMIGVDDYRGEGLDLNYASKDAIDLQKAMELSSKKIFNFDGINRVHFFTLVNKKDGTIVGITPDRNNILTTIDKVEKESNPEDIFLVFFAGHGALIENKLNLLTSEASLEQAPNFSGITTQEILEKLSKIKAGKRILFLDACHSGAAINDLGINSLVGKRDTEDLNAKAKRDKELDRIASKSGLAIITASSSDQVANELPQYEHGLLTYSLLKTMLNEPNSLDKDNQLQLEDWLRETEKMVATLRNDQSTQKFVPLNYTIGKIDDEVRGLVLLHEVPMLFLESVININLGSDDLHLGNHLRNLMNGISSRGLEQKVIISEKLSSTSDLIRVLYTINKNEISCSVILLKNEIILKKLEIKGENSNEGIKTLSEKIITEVLKNV
jgi:WD40 repeat protein/uncharacterized caspase-like protein